MLQHYVSLKTFNLCSCLIEFRKRLYFRLISWLVISSLSSPSQFPSFYYSRKVVTVNRDVSDIWTSLTGINQKKRRDSVACQCAAKCSTKNSAKAERAGSQNSASSAVLAWHLTHWLSLLRAPRQFPAGEEFHRRHRRQECIASRTPGFYDNEMNKFGSHLQKCGFTMCTSIKYGFFSK